MYYPASQINVADYVYNLPDERIAKFPENERDKSKLLVCRNGTITTDVFSNLPDYFNSDDTMIFNNSRVIQARVELFKNTGARIEIFCLEPFEPADYQLSFTQKQTCVWKCMVNNFRKWDSETVLEKKVIYNGMEVQLQAKWAGSSQKCHLIRFNWDNEIDFGTLLDVCGQIPIPPYLKRKSEAIDETRYQTVYSKQNGSVAAPTAGLHFTPQVLMRLSEKGAKQNEITLHVGAGTFKPIKNNNVAEHDMHVEFFSASLKTIQDILKNKGVMTAIGTTSLRTLESIYWLGVKMLKNKKKNHDNFNIEQWECYTLPQEISVEESLKTVCEYLLNGKKNTLFASTNLMIVPGYKFRIVKRLLTNFHQSQSSLLLLVSAFIGEQWRDIYEYALKNDFRFLSYGDTSLLEIAE